MNDRFGLVVTKADIPKFNVTLYGLEAAGLPAFILLFFFIKEIKDSFTGRQRGLQAGKNLRELGKRLGKQANINRERYNYAKGN